MRSQTQPTFTHPNPLTRAPNLQASCLTLCDVGFPSSDTLCKSPLNCTVDPWVHFPLLSSAQHYSHMQMLSPEDL